MTQIQQYSCQDKKTLFLPMKLQRRFELFGDFYTRGPFNEVGKQKNGTLTKQERRGGKKANLYFNSAMKPSNRIRFLSSVGNRGLLHAVSKQESVKTQVSNIANSELSKARLKMNCKDCTLMTFIKGKEL